MTLVLPADEKTLLSDEDVVNLLGCAGYGISGWACFAQIDPVAKTYRVVERCDPAEDEEKTLTFDEIREAFLALYHLDLLPDWQVEEIDADDLYFDSTVGDMVVQYAAFKELVYS